jgi:hypothetical protein
MTTATTTTLNRPAADVVNGRPAPVGGREGKKERA